MNTNENAVKKTTTKYPLNLLYAIAERYGEKWGYEQPQDLAGTVEYVLCTYLSSREVALIHSRYAERRTLQFIASTMKITKERVRQLEAKAMNRLHTPEIMELLAYGISGATKRKMSNTLTSAKKVVQSELESITDQLQNACRELNSFVEMFMPSLSEDIAILELSVRSYKVLKDAGISTIGDLVALSSEQLSKLRNMGTRSYAEIIKALSKHGF